MKRFSQKVFYKINQKNRINISRYDRLKTLSSFLGNYLGPQTAPLWWPANELDCYVDFNEPKHFIPLQSKKQQLWNVTLCH